MKQLLLSIGIIISLFSIAGAKPVNKNKAVGPFSHKLQLSSMCLHLGDPDWKDLWIRRNFVPSYQIGYKRYFLKARLFSLSNYDNGILYLIPETLSNGEVRIKEGSVVCRDFYKTFDLLASIALVQTHRQNLLAGIGATHRKGRDYVQRYDPLNNVPDIGIGDNIGTNEWGGIAEICYSVSFLKYLVASGCRLPGISKQYRHVFSRRGTRISDSSRRTYSAKIYVPKEGYECGWRGLTRCLWITAAAPAAT